jgi:hypothetical protein
MITYNLLHQHLHCTDNSDPAKTLPQALKNVQPAASSVPVLSKHERKKAKAKAKKQLRKQASSGDPQPTAIAAAPPAVVAQKKMLSTADSGAVSSSKKRRRDDANIKPQKLVSKVTEHPFPAGQYVMSTLQNCCCCNH